MFLEKTIKIIVIWTIGLAGKLALLVLMSKFPFKKRVEVYGFQKEKLDYSGRGQLIICNHPSLWEPVLLIFLFTPFKALFSLRHVPYIVVDRGNFYDKWWFFLFRPFVIAVERGEIREESKAPEKIRSLLEKGNIIILLPEGGRTENWDQVRGFRSSSGKRIARFPLGLRKLLVGMNCLVLPIWSEGGDRVILNIILPTKVVISGRAIPKSKKIAVFLAIFPRVWRKTKIVVGDPFEASVLPEQETVEYLERSLLDTAKAIINTIGIVGMGFYVPQRIKTNEEVLSDIRQALASSENASLKAAWLGRDSDYIVKTTGIKERRIAAPEEASSDLALRAAEKALVDAEISPKDLDCIIVATTTPDHFTPSTACFVQANLRATNLKMAPLDINGACAGSVIALRLAEGLVAGGLRHVLVIGSEVISRFIHPQNPSSYVLFGDGAAAAVVGKSEEMKLLKFLGGGDGSQTSNIIVPDGGSRRPSPQDTFRELQNYLQMKGSFVYRFAVRKFPEIALEIQECFLDDDQKIGLIIPHQANLKIIESARERLGYSPEQVFVNIDKYGNTSAPSVLIGLCEAREQNRLKKGDLIALISFGAGMVWESSLIEF